MISPFCEDFVFTKFREKRALAKASEFTVFVNSEDPAKMPHYVSFHTGVHCLPKYMFTSIQNENDLFFVYW